MWGPNLVLPSLLRGVMKDLRNEFESLCIIELHFLQSGLVNGFTSV